jgi:hypothetical protein
MRYLVAFLAMTILIPSLAAAGAGTSHRVRITREAVGGAFDYEKLSARRDRACMAEGIVLENATAAPVSIDLYEAQTDVGFPFGRLAPGQLRDVPLTRAARIIVVDAVTGNALALVSVEDCKGG